MDGSITDRERMGIRSQRRNDSETYGPLDEIAWYSANGSRTTHPVGMKLPNAFGLYDMLSAVVKMFVHPRRIKCPCKTRGTEGRRYGITVIRRSPREGFRAIRAEKWAHLNCRQQQRQIVGHRTKHHEQNSPQPHWRKS
jgi:hypothetical protein